MAKRLSVSSDEQELRIVGKRDAFMASRIQRISLNKEIPSDDVYELGNNGVAGITKNIPSITLSFTANDTSIKIFSVLTGTDPTSYPSTGVDISEIGNIDAILYVKDEYANDYFKSIHARRMAIRDMSLSYSVDGTLTESYTAIGSSRKFFTNDVIVDKFTSGTTSFTLSQTPIQLKSGNYLLSVILDGVYLEETTGSPSTGEYSVSGTTLTTGDSLSNQLLVVYHADPSGDNWSYISDTEIPAGITGKDAKIVIGANDIYRVQSVNVRANFNPQPVKELGNRDVVGYKNQTISVTGDITVLDTDTDLVELLATGSTSSGDTEFDVGEGCGGTSLGLEIKIYDPCETQTSGNILKTIYIPSIEITGDSYTANVNNNATVTYNFKSSDSQCIVYSGMRA